MNLNNIKPGDRVESCLKGWGTVKSVGSDFFTTRFDATKDTFNYLKNGKFLDTDLHQEIIQWEPRKKTIIYNTNEIFLRDMNTAPKDKQVILLWETFQNGVQSFDIRVAFHAKNTPVWLYVDDCDYIKEIVNPIGWMPYPKTTNKEETNGY